MDRHAAVLELYARQWCDCSEDVVQEALIELVQQTRPPDDAVAWLYRVVRNKALSASRSARRRKRHETAAASGRAAWFERSAADAIDARVAAAALESLPIEQREVVVARVWGGLSFGQIGPLVGASQSAVHRRYVAALAALRQKLRVPCLKND
jgi:RNA polymerase sigma factor (sigma-70 family)